jgi:hypothetical protein
MASLLYDSFADDVSKGNINASADTFFAMLVTSTYAPNKATHAKRSDVTNEVAASGTYAAGGGAVACTVAKDTVNHKETLTFAGITFTGATITARAAVIYKHRGGASTADELVGYVDFGADIASTAGNFAVTFSTPLTIQN